MPKTPSPLLISPTQAWDGNDGPWSTFFLGFGTPPQYTRMLISLTVVLPWPILPQGCIPTDPADCGNNRGALFLPNESTTWKDQGLYTLESEKNLGFDDNGDFGYDTLTLGLPGTGAPALEKQVLAGIAAKDFYVGLWGLGPRPTNFTTLDNPYPSLMTNLKENQFIPSISYGYTAGAQYRLKQVAGSLTLGGYDDSRFVSNNVSFNFAGDVSRDLVIGVQSITVVGLNGTAPLSLLPSPILSFIDSGVSQIWLPLEACNVFESAFGLQYNPFMDLYLVNETNHAALIAQNLSITFTIASDLSDATKASIVLPYAAFDLTLTTDYPGNNRTTHYFPIRRAANETQYTLGRTFLQEAYIVVDYERSNFSVSQCIFEEAAPQDIRTILPISSTHTNSTAIKIGVAATVAIVALVLSCAILLIRYRRRTRRKQMPEHAEKRDEIPEIGVGPQKPGELPEDQRHPPELEDIQKARPELQGCPEGCELEQVRSSLVDDQAESSIGETGDLVPPFELPGSTLDSLHEVVL